MIETKKLPIKPLVWEGKSKEPGEEHILDSTESPTHFYHIVFDKLENSFRVNYYEKAGSCSKPKFVKSIQDGRDWVENVHYPSKISSYLYTIDEILQREI